MINKILDFFFPPKCPFCNELLTGKARVCLECMKTLPFVDSDNSCSICGRPLGEYSYFICNSCQNQKTYFSHAFIPLIYEEDAKTAILRLKRSHPYFAKAFAYLLADKILSSDYYTKFDYITYVPQSPKSSRERGYNQAFLIAKELSSLLKVPCVSSLRRSNDGKPQHTLNAAERRENVKKCYFTTDKTFCGTVLLVDDIYTTGSTANYCSKLLLKMGFEKVYLAAALIRTED